MGRYWKREHERVVRGQSVHTALAEKLAENLKETATEDDGVIDDCEDNTGRAGVATVREMIEQKYLSPDVSRFVETPEIKKLIDQLNLWLGLGYPVQIIGPTGCGKTALATYVASQRGPVVWINGDEQTSTTDLIGGYVQSERERLTDKFVHNVFKEKDVQRAKWVDNPLTLACKYGYALVYNEFSRSKPAANNVLLSILEEKVLELPTKFGEERYVRVHPNFAAVFTSNSIEYAGIHKPQDALLDRMINIYMDYYDFETEVKITQSRVGGASEDVVRKAVDTIRDLREKLPDAQRPGTRACIMLARGMYALNGDARPETMTELCLNVIGSKVTDHKEFVEKRQVVEEAVKAKVC